VIAAGEAMKQTILVADDDRNFVAIMTQLLQGEDFEVLTAYEGIRAVETVHKKKVDLILLDVRMPAGSGLSVLESLGARRETSEIPVIILSGVDDPDAEAKLKLKGARVYLKKPFQKEVLLQKIKELIK
jgi:two-component system response regulator MprA